MYRNGITLMYGCALMIGFLWVTNSAPTQSERSFVLLILCILAALSLRETLPTFWQGETAPPVRETPPPPPAPARPLPRSVSRAGYVYLTQSPSGFYKIGRTSKPNDRIRTFKVKLPIEIEYIHLIETQNMFKLESELHRMFSHKRVGDTEFFRLDAKDIEYIKSL